MKRALLPQSLLSWLYREGTVQQYQRAMHAGFGKVSADKLEGLKFSLPSVDLSDATWTLAYWYRLNEDYQRALDQLLLRRIAHPQVLDDCRHTVVKVDILLKLGRVEEARSVVNDAINRLGRVSELCFSAANVAAAGSGQTSEIDQLRLSWLNKTFVGAGFAPIEPKNHSAPLTIDNIAVPAAQPHTRSSEARISVLMPAYNAAETIITAMDSVLSQTWLNLELVVVDDGSSDGTWSAIESVARRDTRVMPLKHSRNSGAYAARNTALRHATGELVTVHDADDWTHPEKLALQAVALIDSGVANLTRQIRVRPCMRVYVKPDGATILTCYASLMMPRETLLDLGGWDESRMGADGELWDRLLLRDRGTTEVLAKDTPLTLYRFREASLTATRVIGVSTLRYGPRAQYIAAYQHWHRLEMEKDRPDLVLRPGERRFPIPHICRPGPPRRLEYDILLVSDFSLPGGTTSSNVNMLRAAEQLGLRCTCFHWPRLEFAERAVNVKIRQLLHDGVADNLVAGESVRCKLVIVNHPPILEHIPDTLPDVEADGCVIVVNQTPTSRTEGGQTLYELANVIANARAAFGVTPKLAPLSPLVRRLLQPTAMDVALTDLDWTPLIDPKQYRRPSSLWNASRSPIVGRHGRDSPDKWPAEREALRLAYCANAGIEVRILGGAGGAKRVLRRIPSNWVVFPFDSFNVAEFLRELDFFIHYPHQHWIEAFGRAPMEAMATGVPVILPRHFQETFADAAVYAESADVLSTIHRLWSDRDAYEAQIQHGFDYVEIMCCFSRFEERVRPFLQRPADRRTHHDHVATIQQ